MKIGIIGAGNIGGALTRRFRALGHEVLVANSRGPETLRELATETGAKAVTAKEAARAGEVVIVTIPEGHIPDLPKDFSRAFLTMWSSWTPVTIIPVIATAGFERSKLV